MKLNINLAFAALFAAASVARADMPPGGVNVLAEGVPYSTSHDMTVPAGQTCTFYNWATAPTLSLTNGATCRFDGTWDNSYYINFTLREGASYLEPCGFQDGVRLVCEGPEATCD